MNRILRRIFAGADERTSALVYINGHIEEGNTHPDIVTKYLEEHNLSEVVTGKYLRDMGYSDEEIRDILHHGMLGSIPHELYNKLAEYNRTNVDFNLPYAAADVVRVNGQTIIRVYTNFLQRVSLSRLVQKLVAKYPRAIIKDYDTGKILYKPEKETDTDVHIKKFHKRVDTSKYDGSFNKFVSFITDRVNAIKDKRIKDVRWDIDMNAGFGAHTLPVTVTFIGPADVERLAENVMRKIEKYL